MLSIDLSTWLRFRPRNPSPTGYGFLRRFGLKLKGVYIYIYIYIYIYKQRTTVCLLFSLLVSLPQPPLRKQQVPPANVVQEKVGLLSL
jgi:hypothetical protein